MIEILRQHIIDRLGNDVENIDDVLERCKQVKVKRNDIILREGETCSAVYFVAKGCLQVFVYNHDSAEITRDIVTENNWCSELVSFSSQQPATENIRAIEPSVLFSIDRVSFQALVESVPQFDKVYKQILEFSYVNSVYRINSFLSMNALERIKWLMEYRPNLMTRLSSKLIASYLGISPETFSRLKSKL
ncbi:MAG: Crp/Fnr family transcriptional regulator [Ignavibacteria bacterium]|nr:Crp/Fnr family transcriptional regulator [Ignavibacteria bacterium]